MAYSRSIGVVCALFAVVTAPSARADEPMYDAPVWDAASASSVIIPHARASAADAVVVYMHGICGRPEHGCPVFRASSHARMLVCPEAPGVCGGGRSWTDPMATVKVIERARASSLVTAGIGSSDRPLVIAAFSQGGYALKSALPLMRGKVKSALIIGADVSFTVDELHALGIERLALGAGRYDMTYPGLRKTYERLLKAGFPVRFVDLGNVGHTYYAKDDSPIVGDAVAWLTDVGTSSSGVAAAR